MRLFACSYWAYEAVRNENIISAGSVAFCKYLRRCNDDLLVVLGSLGTKATEGLLSLTACLLQLYINTGVICRVLLSCSNEPEATSYR